MFGGASALEGKLVERRYVTELGEKKWDALSKCLMGIAAVVGLELSVAGQRVRHRLEHQTKFAYITKYGIPYWEHRDIDHRAGQGKANVLFFTSPTLPELIVMIRMHSVNDCKLARLARTRMRTIRGHLLVFTLPIA